MARNYLRLAVGTFRVTEISRFHLAELNTDIPLAKAIIYLDSGHWTDRVHSFKSTAELHGTTVAT